LTHLRTVIRNAAVAAVTGLTTTATRVHAPRAYGSARSALPALAVDIVAEETAADTLAAREIRRATLELRGTAVASTAVPDVSAVLDRIDEETAVALFADGTLSAALLELEFNSMAKEYVATGEDLRGEIVIEYRIQYCINEGAPSGP
jgi:hypothetical protein